MVVWSCDAIKKELKNMVQKIWYGTWQIAHSFVIYLSPFKYLAEKPMCDQMRLLNRTFARCCSSIWNNFDTDIIKCTHLYKSKVEIIY